MENLDWRSLPALALCLFCCGASAQTAATAACTLPAPVFTTSAPNIFNDRQEQDLGDALAEFFESSMKIAPPAADDELTRIGEKLLATLPPTQIHYRFRIYDSGEVNGFSVAGGRVYISRKLIASVKNEDELAGVLAHELGHLTTHQTAIAMTRMFRIQLGVTQVGDRADIFAKVHKLLSTPEKDNEEEDDEKKDQLVADHVALYAMVRAGYAPESFASFLNQIMMNHGKTGNWLSDAFGLTHESSQRYRSALKLIAELPAGCAGRQPSAGDAFLAWQRSLVEERMKPDEETATGDQPTKLDPPLRPSPWRVRFSLDGKYLLAQDEGSITVIDRAASRVLFQIDAPDAEQAQFTPDSLGVVFHDNNLRVERWDVVTGHRMSVKELVVYDGCSQTLLSPDGRTLVCAKADLSEFPPKIGLRLIDVESGAPFYDKPKFFQMSELDDYWSYLRFAVDAITGRKMVQMQITPDGHYLLVVVGLRALAYDLQNRREMALGGKLKDLTESVLCFVGSNELFQVSDQSDGKLRRGYLYSFPDGRQLKEMDIGDQSIEGVSKGEALIAWPLESYAVGLVDLNQGKIVAGSKFSTMDQWDNWVAGEDPRGGIQVSQLGSPASVQIPVPLGPLPPVRAAAFSPDGRFLALSLRNRSAVWDLETGKQTRLMRPFRAAWVDASDRLWGQFPKYGQRDAVELNTSLTADDPKALGKYEDTDWQYRNLQYSFKPIGNSKNTRSHATLQAKKMDGQVVAWTRDYEHETPAWWPADDNRLVLAWDLSTEGARDEFKRYPQLKAQADALKDHKPAILLETVIPETGAPLEQVIVPDVELGTGLNGERFALISGEYALVSGGQRSTLIYRLDSGAKVGEFFGAPVATDSRSGLIAAVNRDNEILMVDERTGKELNRFTLSAPVRLARLVGGKTLLVLTADQVVHRLPIETAADAAGIAAPAPK